MSSEQLLLDKWRNLTPDKQQEVFDFIESLEFRLELEVKKLNFQKMNGSANELSSQSLLGEKLKKIRSEIEADGVPLLNTEEIEQEKAERRGGYQED